MSDAIYRPRTYEEGLRDGFIKGQEEANKVMQQMLQTACKPAVVCILPETEVVKLLKESCTKAKEIIRGLLIVLHETATDEYDFEKACPYQYKEAKDFLEEVSE